MGGAVGGDLGEGRGQWAVGIVGRVFRSAGFPGPSSEPWRWRDKYCTNIAVTTATESLSLSSIQ